jgi:hypothetical protein
MATLSTIPDESAPLAKPAEKPTSLKRLVAGAALASFVLGLMAATAISSAAPSMSALSSQEDCNTGSTGFEWCAKQKKCLRPWTVDDWKKTCKKKPKQSCWIDTSGSYHGCDANKQCSGEPKWKCQKAKDPICNKIGCQSDAQCALMGGTTKFLTVRKSNFRRPTPSTRHASVAASARWRGDFTLSTRRCPRDRVAANLTHWLISTQVLEVRPLRRRRAQVVPGAAEEGQVRAQVQDQIRLLQQGRQVDQGLPLDGERLRRRLLQEDVHGLLVQLGLYRGRHQVRPGGVLCGEISFPPDDVALERRS